MKIRTITAGIDLASPRDFAAIKHAARFNRKAKKAFERNGCRVQTTRIATQPWPEYLGGLAPERVIADIKNIEEICLENGIDFVSIGYCETPKSIDLIPDIIKTTSIISAATRIGGIADGINHEAARNTAKAILRISRETSRGYGNFRFAGTASCPPHIPFFPASYHRGVSCFAIGLECSDLVVRALAKAKGLSKAGECLRRTLEGEMRKIEKIAVKVAREEGFLFRGIDVSPAPSLKEKESIALAFEKLGMGKFGSAGTMAIAGMITEVLKTVNVKKCGYCGLMLPVLEDFGLAQRCSQGVFDIDTLLAYSAVCGTGLDCVPLPGDVSENKLYSILLDVATLAIKLNKPLSARLFPVPHKTSGEMTSFKSPYLIDCRIMRIK